MNALRHLMRAVVELDDDVLRNVSEIAAGQPDDGAFHMHLALRIARRSRRVDNISVDHRPEPHRAGTPTVLPAALATLALRHGDDQLTESLCVHQLEEGTVDQIVEDLSTSAGACATLAAHQLTLTEGQARRLAERDNAKVNALLLGRSDTPDELAVALLQGRTFNPRARKIKRVAVDLDGRYVYDGHPGPAQLLAAAPTSSSIAVIRAAVRTVCSTPDRDGSSDAVVELLRQALFSLTDPDLPAYDDGRVSLSFTQMTQDAADTFDNDTYGPFRAFNKAVSGLAPHTFLDHVESLRALLMLLAGTVADDVDDLQAWRGTQLALAFPGGTIDPYDHDGPHRRLLAAAHQLDMLDMRLTGRIGIDEIVRVANTAPHLLNNEAWDRLVNQAPTHGLCGISPQLVAAFHAAGKRFQAVTGAGFRAPFALGNFDARTLEQAAETVEPARDFFAVATCAGAELAALLTARFGDDRAAWTTLFALASEFEGTAAELFDCCEQLAPV